MPSQMVTLLIDMWDRPEFRFHCSAELKMKITFKERLQKLTAPKKILSIKNENDFFLRIYSYETDNNHNCF